MIHGGVVHRLLLPGFFQKGETTCEKSSTKGEQDAPLLGNRDVGGTYFLHVPGHRASCPLPYLRLPVDCVSSSTRTFFAA